MSLPRHSRPARALLALGMLLVLSAAAPCPARAQPTLATLAELARSVPRTPGPASDPAPGESFADAQQLLEVVQAADSALGRSDGARIAIFGAAPPDAAERTTIVGQACILILAADAAARTIDRAIERSDRTTPLGDDRADAEQDAIDLALHARQVVLPLRAAQAALVLAALESDPARRRPWLDSAEALASGVEPVSTWAETHAPLVRALAALLGSAPDRALRLFEDASAAAHAEDAPRDSALLADDIDAQATLGAALATLAQSGPTAARASLSQACERPPFLRGGVRDPALALLAAEVFWRIASAEAAAARDEPRRIVAMNSGYQRFAALLQPGATSADPSVLRALVLRRVSRLTPAALPLASLHPLAAIARAQTLGQGDPVTAQEEVVRALESVLARPPEGRQSVGPETTMALARLDAASDHPARLLRAATLLLQFARDAPKDDRAGAAIAGAAAAAESAARAAPDPQSSELLLRALREADASTLAVPGQSALRLRLAVLLIAMPTEAGAAEVQQVLSRISDPALASEAARLSVLSWTALLQQRRFGGLQAGGEGPAARAEAIARTARRLLDAAESAHAALAGQPPSAASPALLAEIGAAEAEALAARGDYLAALGAVAPALALSSTPETLPIIAHACAVATEACIALDRHREMGAWITDNGPLGDAARARLSALSAVAWRRLEPLTRSFPVIPAAEGPTPDELAILRAAAVHPRRGNSASDPAPWAWAWGLLLTGAASEAAKAFEALDPVTGVCTPAQRLMGLGESHLARGEDQPAFDAFRRIALAEEVDGARSRDYWHAWTRMLEILSRQNKDGSRTPIIRRELARLRASGEIPPDCAARLEAIDRALRGP